MTVLEQYNGTDLAHVPVSELPSPLLLLFLTAPGQQLRCMAGALLIGKRTSRFPDLNRCRLSVFKFQTQARTQADELLPVLPFLFPAATPGLFVGCIIANLFSPYPLDVLCGSAATLIACLLTQRMPNRWLAPLPPVLFNAVIVGAEIAWFETGFGPGFWQAFGFNALTVGLGELIACVLLGELLLSALPRVPVLHHYLAQRRQLAK